MVSAELFTSFLFSSLSAERDLTTIRLVGNASNDSEVHQGVLDFFDEEAGPDEAGPGSNFGDSSGAQGEADMDSEQREERRGELQVRLVPEWIGRMERRWRGEGSPGALGEGQPGWAGGD